MKRIKNIIILIGVVAVSAVFINAVQSTNPMPEATNKTVAKDKDSLSLVHDYNVYALKIPAGINFAGERVPVEDPDVKERMDRELLVNTYWQSNGLLLIKRANKYFPIIEPILKKHGVPDDLKYIAVIESGLTQAISPAGATGFWQLMKGTAREYGLEVNDNVDERYHIEKSTEVACEYLKKAKDRFGSWTMAAAAYNAGQFGMAKQLERQEVENYYNVLLGEETGRYVFRILALKEILSNPESYGFNFDQEDLYTHIPVTKMEVDTVVTDFPKFAKKFGINYKVLKIHNPWLRETHLNNASHKKYYIEIPKEGYYPPAK
ncbi:lytic transglycosylase domain-containing protein [Galbibacter orientalis]|uniref:Soluble lytic murein transglycosylase-like protein n=1 Tax=Galbibacter orientalis DSM 19592 TaxID=926559 RepID=I3CAZ6_9FLAO|nr:lytic transglycosylase domain-containing protein [Galbibacter orientalis]EIJ40789.1 soluble lytic murein transglycosylase-like protein [Galbibacter orientalis DSM 19592]